MQALRQFFRERVPIDAEQLRELTNEPVPHHMKHWWFALGGTPAYLFVVQIITGILLAFYYSPGEMAAYESVEYITHGAAYGWYIRSVHKWGATFMIAAVILHQMRVYFTGAYRRPRELNWMIGMSLLFTTLTLGFTGYSLVYEQLSYWGATVGANIADTVPFVGNFAKQMLLGGETYGPQTLPRFYVVHAAILPGLLIALLAIHIGMIRLQGITELEFKDAPKEKEKKHFNFYPDHMMTELTLGLVLMIVLTTLALTFPAELGPKADPLTTPEIIKPEWFFYVIFRWLKLFSGVAAVLSTGFIIFLMFVWPFVDAWIRRNTKFADASFYIGIVSVIVIIGFTVWEALVAH